jgi:hypothetical protein
MLFKGVVGIVGYADFPLDWFFQNTLIFPLGLLATPTSLRIELAQSTFSNEEDSFLCGSLNHPQLLEY